MKDDKSHRPPKDHKPFPALRTLELHAPDAGNFPVVHVWGPALEAHRNKVGGAFPFPTVAVRFDPTGTQFYLVDRVLDLQADLAPIDPPLPGTGGKAVCVLKCKTPFVRVGFYGHLAGPFDAEGDPVQIIADVVSRSLWGWPRDRLRAVQAAGGAHG